MDASFPSKAHIYCTSTINIRNSPQSFFLYLPIKFSKTNILICLKEQIKGTVYSDSPKQLKSMSIYSKHKTLKKKDSTELVR